MPMRPTFDLEIIKRTATWAEQIVRNDPEWQDYAGTGQDVGSKLAMVDTARKYLFKDNKALTGLLNLYRLHLMQQRKAYFGGLLANQITMLALLKGAGKRELSAIERILDGSDETNPDANP